MFRDFSQKSDLLERHTPVLPYTASTPPPPPPRAPHANPFLTLSIMSIAIFFFWNKMPQSYKRSLNRTIWEANEREEKEEPCGCNIKFLKFVFFLLLFIYFKQAAMPTLWRMATSAPSTTGLAPRTVTGWCRRAPRPSISTSGCTRRPTRTLHRRSSALQRPRSPTPTSTPHATPSSWSMDIWILTSCRGTRTWRTRFWRM